MSIRNTVLALIVVPLAMNAATPAVAGFKGKLAGPGFLAGGPGKGPGGLFGGGPKGPVLIGGGLGKGPVLIGGGPGKGAGNFFAGGLKGRGSIASGPTGKRNGFNGPLNIAIGPAKGTRHCP